MTTNQFLKSQQGRAYLCEQYHGNKKSIAQIANELGVYPNVIRRAMVAHDIERRDYQDAVKTAVEKGRLTPPVAKGQQRSEETKRRISETKRGEKDNEEIGSSGESESSGGGGAVAADHSDDKLRAASE